MHAAEQTILGNSFLVANSGAIDKRKLIAKAKESGSPDTIFGDPTVSGATLTVGAFGTTSNTQIFPLPQGMSPSTGKPFWSGDFLKGYKYKDPKGDNGPIKGASIKQSGSGLGTACSRLRSSASARTVRCSWCRRIPARALASCSI